MSTSNRDRQVPWRRLSAFVVIVAGVVLVSVAFPKLENAAARSTKSSSSRTVGIRGKQYEAVVSPSRGISDGSLGPITRVSAAFGDTTLLAEFTFDAGGGNPEGWISVDGTIQPDTLFHIDGSAGALTGGTYGRLLPLEGNNSLWCGVAAGGPYPYNTWETLPGYGNSWAQYFESVAFPVTDTVTVRYKAAWDTESGYDFAYLQYDDVASGWTTLRTYTGIGETSEAVIVPPAGHGGTLRLRFAFVSEGGWSDEDGNYDSDGAVLIDSLAITDSSGQVDFQDFESETIGALTTNDGDWRANIPPGFGDFAALYNAVSVLQEDPCAGNVTTVWGFFDDPASTNYGCGGHPEQGAVPYGPDSLGRYIDNDIWSPWIEMSGVGSDVRLQFDVYEDLGPLTNGNSMFYSWKVRSWVSGSPGQWKDDGFVHYGNDKGWLSGVAQIGQLIEPGADSIQVALRVVDLSYQWGDGCHSHSPLFDNVRVVRIDDTGPAWSVRDAHLFQDNFAYIGGPPTGFVRLDMALSFAPGSYVLEPRDSIVVQVFDPGGLGTDATYGGAAVYCYVHVLSDVVKAGTSIQSPDVQRYEGDPGAGLRYPWVADVGIGGDTWSQFRMDSVYTQSGITVADAYCFDLMDIYDYRELESVGNVGVFTPGDTVFYFFGARNALGQWTYWSRPGGTTDQAVDAAGKAMEMTCLPANALHGATNILYVADYGYLRHGVQPDFEEAFAALGIRPDRYDVLDASAAVNNGPGTRYRNDLTVYDIIIWDSGDVTQSLSPRIHGDEEPTDLNYGMLDVFLDQPNHHLYMSGDHVATEMKNFPSWPDSIIHFSVYSTSHADLMPLTPSVVGQTDSIFYHGAPDTWLCAGDCPDYRKFDVLTAVAPATEAAAYMNTPGLGAVLTEVRSNSSRVVLSGASFHKIRNAEAGASARIDHLRDILNWFGQGITYNAPCEIDPAVIDFDTVAVNGQVDSTFTITNTGTAVLSGTVTSTCEHYQIVSGASYSLDPGEIDTVTVRYSPPSAARHICVIETGLSECEEVTCTGVGTLAPACDLSPTSIDFGTIAEVGQKDATFVIKHVGFGGTLDGTVGEACGEYDVTFGSGPYSLAPGESLLVGVRFQPTTAGTYSCTIGTGAGLCGDVAVTGRAVPCLSVMYVDSSAVGSGDGSSWADACTELWDALAIASPCSTTTEIWVAKGTYKPTAGTDRFATFQLRNNLAIYGGFNGTEVSLSERDWMTNVTILSGDIGAVADSTDNCYHVVTGSGTDTTAVFDGFTVTGGNADSGGIDVLGGGMINSGGSPTLTNVTFVDNAAALNGAGMFVGQSGHPRLTNVQFKHNSAGGKGGGVFIGVAGATVVNVVFEGNSAGRGGGIDCSQISDVTITNATFTGNSATYFGGAVYNESNSHPLVTNTIMWGNTSPTSPQVYNQTGSAPVISYSLIAGCGGSGVGWDPLLGTDGGGNLDVNPQFIDAPGNLRLSVGSPAINAGDNAAPSLPATDIEGNPRILDGIVDMGAYENRLPAPATADIHPTSLYFGRLAVGDSTDTTFVVKNIGDFALDGNVGESCPDFSVLSGGGPFSLAPDESITVAVRFAPTAAGSLGCFIDTDTDAPNELTIAYLADGPSGLLILDVSNPAAPALLGGCATPGSSNDVAVVGDLVFVADAAAGLQVVDASDPTSPTIVGSYDTPQFAEGVVVEGDYAYVANGFAGLYVIDVSDSTSPALVGNIDTPANAYDVAISGNYAFIADYVTLQVMDVTDPANPTFAGSYDTPGSPYALILDGNTAYVASAFAGLHVMDVSDPPNPTLLGTYNSTKAQDVALAGTYAHVADASAGLRVVDVSNPAMPALVATHDTPGDARGVAVFGDYIYVADSDSGMQAIDVSIPAAPAGVGAYNAGGSAYGIAVLSGNDVVCTGYAGYEHALIDSIVDVPNDQGGLVRIHMTRSIYDFVEETQLPIVMYTLYRRVDAAAAAAIVGSSGRKRDTGRPARVSAVFNRSKLPDWPITEHDGRLFVTPSAELVANGFPPGTWEIVYGFGPTQHQNYVAVVPTEADSTASGIPYSVHLVTAHTTTPAIWFASPVDSGYSADNIAPGVPQAFSVAYNTGSGNQLAWDPSPEPDFQYYRVYRGGDEGFTPDTTNVVHETAIPAWTDPDHDGPGVHYKVTAIDDAGNESDPAAPGTVTSAETPVVPTTFALYQNVPNPFNPTTVIRYDVPAAGGVVTLCVYDVAGRLVRTLVDEVETTGEKRVVWNGQNDHGKMVATGVYFYRMKARGFTKTRKMVLLK